MKSSIYTYISKVITRLSRYCDKVEQLETLEWDPKKILNKIKHPQKTTGLIDSVSDKENDRNLYLFNGNLNYSYDIKSMLDELHSKINRNSRCLFIIYNSYLAPIYKILSVLGLKSGPMPTTFISKADIENIFKISKFDILIESYSGIIPFYLFGLGPILNKILGIIPGINNLSLFTIVLTRPVKRRDNTSLSIIIPARNEKGNIEPALKRLPDMGNREIEVIYVEGNSSDGTWEEIERVSALTEYSKYGIQKFKQPGKGKYDAVKVGFKHATKDLLIILDADLTVPPELLPQFVEAYEEGYGDFINGSRLVYPMESEAMRPLNLLGNKFFAKVLSVILEQRMSDTLCGTKILLKKDYERLEKWRQDFGEFDPFGDFELLFAASVLNLGIVNIPVHYRDRTYGSTQISRFRDGFLLLRMTFVAFFKIRLRRI